MANVFSNFMQQVVQGDTLKDRDHASKLYVANNYALAPKNTFLYHVFFDINPAVQAMNGMKDSSKQTELGMLVKSVTLPDYSMDVKSLNAYNRSHLVQTKLHYNPVNIQFHDDSSDIVRNFWFDYYNYYYRNSDYGGSKDYSPQVSARGEISGLRQQKDWGYTIRGTTTGKSVSDPYLLAIRIYSLYNKQFSEYILLNPFIKTFKHGEHNASGDTDVMSHSMSVEYESVLYSYGTVSTNTVKGFGSLHYDTSPSSLSAAGGGTKSLLGPGGLVDSVGDISGDLASGNLAGALFKGARVTNGMRGASFGAMVVPEAVSLIRGGLSGNNPFGAVAVPGLGSLFGAKNAKRKSGINDMETSGTGSQGIGNAVGSTTGVGGIGSALSAASGLIDKGASFVTDAARGASNFVSGLMPSNLPASGYTESDESAMAATRSERLPNSAVESDEATMAAMKNETGVATDGNWSYE